MQQKRNAYSGPLDARITQQVNAIRACKPCGDNDSGLAYLRHCVATKDHMRRGQIPKERERNYFLRCIGLRIVKYEAKVQTHNRQRSPN